jgi:hypothetical protein
VARRIAAAWFGGALGALVNSLLVWLLAGADVLDAIGVEIRPVLSADWLVHRLVWGSLWGLGYPLAATADPSPVRAGLLLSLAPSAAQLLFFYPRAGHGMLGLSLGTATPLVVLAANAVWGWVLGRSVLAAGAR